MVWFAPAAGYHLVNTLCRPLNSHNAPVRLMISAVISRSHGRGLVSHGVLSVSTTD